MIRGIVCISFPPFSLIFCFAQAGASAYGFQYTGKSKKCKLWDKLKVKGKFCEKRVLPQRRSARGA